MRITLLLLLTLITAAGSQTGDKGKDPRRHGVDLDTKRFPQNTPKDALGSVLRAIGEKQFDYLLAHLSDPVFVDQQVAQQVAILSKDAAEGQLQFLAFDRLVKTTAAGFLEDPTKFKDLQRFHQDGEWEEGNDDAVTRLKSVQTRKVFMRKVAPDRWVLLDRIQ